MSGSLGGSTNPSKSRAANDAMGSQRFQPCRLAPSARDPIAKRDASDARKPILDNECRMATKMTPAMDNRPHAFQAGAAGETWRDRDRRRMATGYMTAKGRHISRKPAKWLWLTHVPAGNPSVPGA